MNDKTNNPYEELVQNPRAAPTPSVSDVPPQLASPGGNPYETLITAPPSPPQPPRQRAFNEPFGELKPAEYSPRERAGNAAQDALIAAGADPYVAGRLGRGALNAASLFPPVGAILSGADTGYYANKGDPIMAGVSSLGIIPGGTTARRAVQGMPTRTLAPAEEQLAAEKAARYKAWENAPVTYHPAMMDDAVGEITKKLIQEGVDPATKQSALDIGLKLKTAGFPPRGLTNNDFEILRRQLSGGKDRSEIRAGEIAKDALEQYLINAPSQHIRSGTPQEIAAARDNLLKARGNAAAEFRSGVITGRETKADIAEELGGEFPASFRRQMGSLSSTKAGEKAMRGFTDAERNKVRDEVTGSLIERGSDALGTALDKMASKIAGVGGVYGGAYPTVGGIAGTGFGLDPVTGAAIAGGLWTGSKMLGKGLQGHSTDLARRSADELGAAMRMRSPLAQEPGSPYGVVTDPAARANDARKYLMYPLARQESEDWVEQNRVPFENR